MGPEHTEIEPGTGGVSKVMELEVTKVSVTDYPQSSSLNLGNAHECGGKYSARR